MSLVKTSKFLSLVLRHRPERIGIELDEAGWTPVEALLEAMARHGKPLTRAQLIDVVERNDKRRFAFNEDLSLIRANQGHSVAVALGYEQKVPPARLYHGTVARVLPSIREQGLLRGERHHVHLSVDAETARTVGARRGRPVILTIDAARMHSDGCAFYLSENEVWLTETVAPSYIVDGL